VGLRVPPAARKTNQPDIGMFAKRAYGRSADHQREAASPDSYLAYLRPGNEPGPVPERTPAERNAHVVSTERYPPAKHSGENVSQKEDAAPDEQNVDDKERRKDHYDRDQREACDEKPRGG
jgi:hypothetical protein